MLPEADKRINGLEKNYYPDQDNGQQNSQDDHSHGHHSEKNLIIKKLVHIDIINEQARPKLH